MSIQSKCLPRRNDTLTREMRKLQASEADLLKKQSSQSDIKNAEAEIIPTTQRILDSYSRLSVPEKNSLWKIVMEKITMYRTPDGEFHSLFQYGISTIASFCGINQYYAITKGGAFYGRTEA